MNEVQRPWQRLPPPEPRIPEPPVALRSEGRTGPRGSASRALRPRPVRDRRDTRVRTGCADTVPDGRQRAASWSPGRRRDRWAPADRFRHAWGRVSGMDSNGSGRPMWMRSLLSQVIRRGPNTRDLFFDITDRRPHFHLRGPLAARRRRLSEHDEVDDGFSRQKSHPGEHFRHSFEFAEIVPERFGADWRERPAFRPRVEAACELGDRDRVCDEPLCRGDIDDGVVVVSGLAAARGARRPCRASWHVAPEPERIDGTAEVRSGRACPGADVLLALHSGRIAAQHHAVL